MAVTVQFGTNEAENVVVVSDTEITAEAPAGSGTVDVSVTTSGGSDTLAGAYTYEP